MEEEENLYYKLFTPLSNKQKEDVFQLWMNNIEEDIIIRKQAIKEYCDNNKCDFMMSLYYIFQNIENKYLCYYNIDQYEKEYKYYDYESLSSFLRKRIVDFLNSGSSLNNEQMVFLNEMLDIIKTKKYYDLSIANTNNHFDFIDLYIDSISCIGVEDDEKDLESQINALSKFRRKNPEEFINNPLNVPYEISYYYFYPEIEKNMYYKIPNSQESYLLYLEKKEKNNHNFTNFQSIFEVISDNGTIRIEYLNELITNLSKDYSIVLIEGLIDETKNHINDRIIKYICKETGRNQEKDDLFFQDFDEVFQEGIDNYFDLGIFDNNNLKLKKLFSKDEFRQYKFILDRLREIRDEKDGVKKKENKALSNDSSNKHTQIQPNIINETYKEKQTHNIQKNKEEPKTEDKYNYEEMTEKLEPFIKNITPSILKNVIENKCLPNKETQTLRMDKDNKSNIVRFADCFDISIPQINKIFEIIVQNNDRNKESRSDFFILLRSYNPNLYKKE